MPQLTTDFNAAVAVSKGLHALLSSSAVVTDALGDPARLYDHAPEDPVFPYLTYGPIRSEDNSADGAVITSHLQTLHIWSRYAGRAEMLGLLGRIGFEIENGPIAVDGAVLISRHVLFTDIFRAADGLTLHGVIRLRLTTEQDLTDIELESL